MTNLQVVMWPVEKLIPYIRNSRTHSDEQIAQTERGETVKSRNLTKKLSAR